VHQAKQATETGRFDEADRLLEQAVDRETAAVVEHQIKVAELRRCPKMNESGGFGRP